MAFSQSMWPGVDPNSRVLASHLSARASSSRRNILTVGLSVVGLGAAGTYALVDDTDKPDGSEAPELNPPTDVQLAIQGTASTEVLIGHVRGEAIHGDRIYLEGTATTEATPATLADLGPAEWQTGTTAILRGDAIQPGRLALVWRQHGHSRLLHEAEVTEEPQ